MQSLYLISDWVSQIPIRKSDCENSKKKLKKAQEMRSAEETRSSKRQDSEATHYGKGCVAKNTKRLRS